MKHLFIAITTRSTQARSCSIMRQIDLFKYYSYSIGLEQKKTLEKPIYKNWEYKFTLKALP